MEHRNRELVLTIRVDHCLADLLKDMPNRSVLRQITDGEIDGYLPQERRTIFGVRQNTVRLSIGIEAPDKLIKDIKKLSLVDQLKTHGNRVAVVGDTS